MQEALWLVRNGVPFDLAFTLDPVTRQAFAIIFGEMEGNAFDWDNYSWTERQ